MLVKSLLHRLRPRQAALEVFGGVLGLHPDRREVEVDGLGARLQVRVCD